MSQINITQAFVNTVSFTTGSKKQILYFDTHLKGFGLCVGKQKKTFFVKSEINKKSRRQAIGSASTFKVAEAKELARKMLMDMRAGIDPKLEAEKQAQRNITLKDAYQKMRQQKINKLSQRTIRDYDDYMKNHFTTWLSKPLTDISSEMVLDKFSDMSKKHKYAANAAMKLLRQIYSFQMTDNSELRNPVDAIAKKRLWNPKKARDTRLYDSDIKEWHKNIIILPNTVFRDAILLIFFTGLRKNEAFQLKWENVNFKEKSIRLPHTKNNKPFEFPLSSRAIEILTQRYKEAMNVDDTKGNISDQYVFPSIRGNGHITDARSSIKIITSLGSANFKLHDLRRTFVSKATEIGVPEAAIQKLVNHTSKNVTHNYTIIDTKRLRDYTEQITNAFLEIISNED